MSSANKYANFGNGYHWRWASMGDSNPYVRWVKQVLDYLPQQGRGATVLDVGCGDGYPASLLIARGYKVTGVDLLPGPLEVARERVPKADFMLLDDFQQMPVTAYDYVLALESLEHMADTSMLLEAIAAAQRYSVVTTPSPGLDDYAVRAYDTDAVVALLSAAGCVSVEIDEGEHRLFKVARCD